MRGLSNLSGCGWAYGFTFTSLQPHTLPQIWESLLKSYLMQVCKPCHYTLVEAIKPFKLHLMSMSSIHEVFEHLLRLWMGIWLHTHTITTTDFFTGLWELAEILPDASVQTIPLCFGWGCRTFQTASHVHVIPIWGDWAPSHVVDGHMASHSHCYHHRHFPRFLRFGWNPTWCKCANHATTLWLKLLNLLNCIPHPCDTNMRCLSIFSGCGWAHGLTLTSLPPQTLPQIWVSWLKFNLIEVCKPCHYTLVEAVELFKLHPISMSYIYEVFECLLRLMMCICLHTHTITTIPGFNLLKGKTCVRVVLHSYLELSWSYGKMLWGMHRTHILPCSHQSVYSGNHFLLFACCLERFAVKHGVKWGVRGWLVCLLNMLATLPVTTHLLTEWQKR